MADDTASLRIDVNGTEEFRTAEAAVAALEAEFNQLTDAVNRGAPGWELAKKRLVDVTQELNAARAASQSLGNAVLTTGPNAFSGQMENASKAAQRYARTLAESATSNRGFRLDLLQVGYALDDLQYGFRGFANNIPSLLLGLGLGGGLAGGISAVAAGANLLYNNWDMLTEAMGGTAVRTAAEEMKYLADMTERTNEQTNRLNELKAQEKQRKADEGGTETALGTRSEADTQAGQLFGEALKKSLDAGQSGPDFAKALTDRVIARQRETDPSAPVDEAAARAAVDERIGQAQAGNQDALRFIQDYARGQGGILGRFDQEITRTTRAADDKQEQERRDAGVNVQARDAVQQNSANRRRTLETDLSGVQSADEFTIVMARINEAVRDSSVSEEDAAALYEKAAEIRRKALDDERESVAKLAQINRDKETDALNRQGAENEAAAAPEIAEAERLVARKQAQRQRREDTVVEQFGNVFAGGARGLNQAMLAADARGERAGETDQRLTQQVSEQLKASNTGLSDEERLNAAARIVQSRRESIQDFAMQRGVASAAMRQQFISNMAPAGTTLGVMQRQQLAQFDKQQASGGLAPEGTTLGVMQRQMLRRQGIDPEAVARMGQINAGQGGKAAPAMTPEQKQEKAAETMKAAAETIKGAAEKIARQEIVL